MLSALSIMLPRAIVAADRIDEVLLTKSSIQESKETKKIEKKSGLVKFEHVDFMYPNAKANVLSDIDFEARPGQTTAIIGSTGCGKSTLVNLIPRLYDVTKGKITIDGVDIKDLKLEDLRNLIGIVPQKGVLFSGDIESNIKFGRDDASMEDVINAASIAQATEFIDKKSDGYKSSIAQGGSNVSGGQKQRLALARTIFMNPAVVLMDEPLSALDEKTRADMQQLIKNDHDHDKNIIIMITHSSDEAHKMCDVVINIEKGELQNGN
jgi:ATP-binding cassette subfamily B protein